MHADCLYVNEHPCASVLLCHAIRQARCWMAHTYGLCRAEKRATGLGTVPLVDAHVKVTIGILAAMHRDGGGKVASSAVRHLPLCAPCYTGDLRLRSIAWERDDHPQWSTQSAALLLNTLLTATLTCVRSNCVQAMDSHWPYVNMRAQ